MYLMKFMTPVLISATTGILLSVCSPSVFARASSAAETACMVAVNDNYGGKVRNLDVVSSEFSQANSEVVINADGQRWRCLVSNDGQVQDLSVIEGHGSASSGATVNSSAGFGLTGRTSGHCKLSNVEAGRELYNGRCSIKETINGSSKMYAIKMGSAQSFKFATSDGRHWMTGPDKVRFEDRGHTGIFRWSDFRLEVDSD
jgi:hypothetical protein